MSEHPRYTYTYFEDDENEITSSMIDKLTTQLEKLEKETTKDDIKCLAFCTVVMACLIIFILTTSIVGTYIWFNFLYVCCSCSLPCTIFWSVIMFGFILIQLLCNILEDNK